MSTELIVKIIYAIVGASLLFAVFIGTGGKAWFGTRERPGRIVGKRVVLHEFDGYADRESMYYVGRVASYDGTRYRINFEESAKPSVWKFASVQYRSAGYPISSARKSGFLPVQGVMDTGWDFIARINTL